MKEKEKVLECILRAMSEKRSRKYSGEMAKGMASEVKKLKKL